MVEGSSKPKLVGQFIKQKREAMGLSQRGLGQLFQPPVTTQFVSNVERGVTPLPPHHVATLAKALQVSEGEIFEILEKEYTAKLTGKLGRTSSTEGLSTPSNAKPTLQVEPEHYTLFRTLYEAYKKADDNSRKAFQNAGEATLQNSNGKSSPKTPF